MDMGKETTQDEFGWFWTGMDADIAASLSNDQKLAIANAIRKTDTADRPADIRFSMFGYFFVLISGKERRAPERIRIENAAHPVITARNLPLLLLIWASLSYATWGILGLITGVVFRG